MQAKKDRFLFYLSGILRGKKHKAECIAADNRQYTPPVCQELACRTIRYILPQNSLKITLVSNSDKSKGVGLCLLPLCIPIQKNGSFSCLSELYAQPDTYAY